VNALAQQYVTGVAEAEAKMAEKIGAEAAAIWKRRCIEQAEMYAANSVVKSSGLPEAS
jgi:hypothetical protein